MTWWLFIPVMVLATMLIGIAAILAARAHPAIRAAAGACALAALAMPVSAVLHNVLSALIGNDEPVTFVLALLVAPAAFAFAAYLVAGALRVERHTEALSRGFAIAATGVVFMVAYMVFALGLSLVTDQTPPYQMTIEAVVLPVAALVTSAGAVIAAVALARDRAVFA